jgi:hypothetical protein
VFLVVRKCAMILTSTTSFSICEGGITVNQSFDLVLSYYHPRFVRPPNMLLIDLQPIKPTKTITSCHLLSLNVHGVNLRILTSIRTYPNTRLDCLGGPINPILTYICLPLFVSSMKCMTLLCNSRV